MPTDAPDDSSHRTLDLPCEIPSVTEARIALLGALEQQGADDRLASDAATVFSELLINAMLHGDPDEDGLVHGSWAVTAEGPDHHVELTVRDAGGSGRPHLELADEDASAGRGLRIVDAMCETWSVDTTVGTTVTAELRTRPGGPTRD